jgi:RNA polymerase-binding transcription factor DksA
MNKKLTKQYRDRLMALAARLGVTVAGLEAEIRVPTGGQSGGGLSNTPQHLGDIGTDVFSQEIGATLLENEAFIRNEVVAALERIDSGTFGSCERCGKAILTARLEALPYARFCTPCAEKTQSKRTANLNNGRPPGWLGKPGYESNDAEALPGLADAKLRSRSDVHAAGTPGGGTAVGGLAGTNFGHGEPDAVALDKAAGSSAFDLDVEAEAEESDADIPETYPAPSGRAVGGTQANKRSRGGRKGQPQRKRSTQE